MTVKSEVEMKGETLRIGGREIFQGGPPYVVAELSGNHGKSFERAVEIIHAAKEAGADAVKLQTYTADTMTIQSSKPYFQIGGGTIWEGQSLYELYGEASTPWEWHPRLQTVAAECGLDLFSTPFDESAVDFLELLAVPAYKVSSFEIVDIELIRRIARTGKPIIISTGMSTLDEIEEAVGAARSEGATQIALVKCTSAYPAAPEEMHLRTITHMAETFHVPVGISDHTLGITAAVSAVALGACIVEKHLTLARAAGGPDATFSLEPAEFKAMVDAVRTVGPALGDVRYGASGRETSSLAFRRSLFVVQNIHAGETFSRENVRVIRPNYGLPPRHLNEVLGKPAACEIERGTPLAWEHVRANHE